MSKQKRVIEKGTVPGCIGTGKPYLPNRCDDCRRHSDFTCADVRVTRIDRRRSEK